MRIFFFLWIIFFPLIGVCQKRDAAIVLDTSMNFIKPDKFYIYDIIDSRKDKSLNSFRVNWGGGQERAMDTLSFSNALLMLFDKYLAKDTTLVPVIIDIRQLSIVPKANEGYPRDEMNIELRYLTFVDSQHVDFAFYSFNQGLYKYMKAPGYLSTLLKTEIPGMVKDLNRFINNSFDNFPYKGIKVRTQFLADPMSSTDTLFYDNSSRLSWNDFKGKPDLVSEASAATGSGFDYSTAMEMKDGYLNILVFIKCFFLTHSSWVKPALASERVLAHEQLHFDINYLGSLKFVDSIAKTKFTVAHWQNELIRLNEVKFNETLSVQDDYDRESDYGRKTKTQLAWRRKIEVMLKESPLKKGGLQPGLINKSSSFF